MFLSTVREARAREDGAQSMGVLNRYFCCFIGLELLNTHSCMCQMPVFTNILIDTVQKTCSGPGQLLK